MEKVINPDFEAFVKVNEYPYRHGCGYYDGSGYGDGYACYDGSGYNDALGSGNGDGYGRGDGSGYGYGRGESCGSDIGYGRGESCGSDIECFRGEKVYSIDNTPTIIYSVHINYARASILNSDLTLTPCFVVKRGNYFAHGKTLKEAFQSVAEKYYENRPLTERIAEFNSHYPDREKKVPAKELFSWHHILTGSCLFGRQQWCQEHNIDNEKGMYSVNEFINLTLSAYGGDVIKQLRDTVPTKL